MGAPVVLEPRHEVRLAFGDDFGTAVDSFALDMHERGLCVREMTFANEAGARWVAYFCGALFVQLWHRSVEAFVAVGTGYVLPKGEDDHALGRVRGMPQTHRARGCSYLCCRVGACCRCFSSGFST